MDKDLFLSLFNNKVILNLIVKFIKCPVVGNVRGKSFEWDEIIFLPHVLASYGYFDTLKTYFEYNPVSIDCEKRTFHNAVSAGSLEIIKFLIEVAEVDIRKTMKKDRTYNLSGVLVYASKLGKFEIVKYLAGQAKFKWDYYAAMSKAPLSGNLELLQFLAARVDPSIDINHNCYKATAFDNAALVGRIDMIQWLEEHRPGDLKYSNMHMFAVRGKQLDTLKYLFAKNLKGKEGKAPPDAMDAAIMSNQLEMVKLLYDNNVRSYSHLSLDWAAEAGNMDLVKWMQENVEFIKPVHAVDKAARKGHLEMVKWLFENRTESVTTPETVCNAISSGNFELVQYLHYEREVEIRYPEKCISAAIANNSLPMLQWLTKQPQVWAQVDECDPFENTIIDIAAEHNRMELLEWIHSNCTEKRQIATSKAMDMAAKNGNLDMLKWLHANRTEGCSARAMDLAAENGNMAVLEWLHQNTEGECSTDAMDNAARNGHIEVVEWLHDNTTVGCTTQALDSAIENEHWELMNFLNQNRTEGCYNYYLGIAVGKSMNMAHWVMRHRQEHIFGNAMTTAARCGNIDVLELLDQQGNDGVQKYEIITLLYEARFEVVKWLIENRTEWQQEQHDTKFNISQLIKYNHFDKIQWLLEMNQTRPKQQQITTSQLNYLKEMTDSKSIETREVLNDFIKSIS